MIRSVKGTTRTSYRSAVRGYIFFCAVVCMEAFTLTTGTVLLWSQTFRCADTCTNYVAGLKWFCKIAALPTRWDCPRVRMAIEGGAPPSRMCSYLLINRT